LNIKYIYYLLLAIAILVNGGALHGQKIINLTNNSLTPARYEINAKRSGITYESKEALPSSREFKRIDPTYYVGWMFEGVYNFNLASDVIGYQNAIAPLEKSMLLIEKDYGKLLKTRTNEIETMFKILQLHRDYDYIASALYESYTYSDDMNKAWKTIRRFQKNNLQDEGRMDSYNMLSWTVHRNRFYTSNKYSFLKDNIADNEKYANDLLDSSIKKINADNIVNKEFFPSFLLTKMTGVYHYKAVLFSYAMNIPSTEYYFDLMKKNGYFPENNYANFCGQQAKFKKAEEYYALASKNEPSDKRLREYIYFQTIIDAYKGKPKESIRSLQEYVKSSGTTPGFGWYQLGISRSLINDGQFVQGSAYASKAENFKEVHIGTTLGQSHYDFTTNVLKLMAKEQEQASVKFEKKKWYFSLSAIWKKINLAVEKFMIQYVIINQFSNNPERDDVIYKLFSSESTISFDEVWALVKDYSTQFFINKFETQFKDEKRPYVKKYYQLFLAKLYIKENEYKKAETILDEILKDENYDKVYEKLFTFRVLEAKLQLLKHADKIQEANEITAEMYCLLPQWMPYTNTKIKMIKTISGVQNKLTASIIEKLDDANVEWVTKKDNETQELKIDFSEKAGIHIAIYSIINSNGKIPMNPITISYTDKEDAFKKLLYGAFTIGNIADGKNIGEPATAKNK
jgi:RPA family protein